MEKQHFQLRAALIKQESDIAARNQNERMEFQRRLADMHQSELAEQAERMRQQMDAAVGLVKARADQAEQRLQQERGEFEMNH